MSFKDVIARRKVAIIKRLGEIVTYDPTGLASDVYGIFEFAYFETDGGDGFVAQASREPILTIMESDVPNLVAGSEFDISDTRYTVSGPPEPDGVGMVTLRLRAA